MPRVFKENLSIFTISAQAIILSNNQIIYHMA